MRLLGDEDGGGGNNGVSDEHILNVFRQSDEKVLKTAEIANELPIGHDWTGKRLNDLETSDRVHSKSAGPGRVWWLDDAEPKNPVREGLGDVIWFSVLFRRSGTYAIIVSAGLFITSGIFALLLFTSYLIPDIAFQIYSAESQIRLIYIAAIGGLMVVFAGLLLRLISIAIPRFIAEISRRE